MEKLSKLTLGNISLLSDEEMKLVAGGSGSGGVCAARGDLSTSGGMTLCTNDASRAAQHAGNGGWWCCNCAEAISRCGSHIS